MLIFAEINNMKLFKEWQVHACLTMRQKQRQKEGTLIKLVQIIEIPKEFSEKNFGV